MDDRIVGDGTWIHTNTASHPFGYYSYDYGARPHSSTVDRLTRDANAPWNSTKWRIDLPLGTMPQFSSVRVQKAYRLNEIEAIRLRRRMQILDSQHLHADRLVNQDIRLTKGALEHIEASTGCLRQAAATGAVGPVDGGGGSWVTADDGDESGSSSAASSSARESAPSELSVKPMFLYGERQVSRKVNRYRNRSQSAAAASFVAVADWKRRKDSVLVGQSQRPKTAAGPLFLAIQEKVRRKISENPDYDPNVDSSAAAGFPGV